MTPKERLAEKFDELNVIKTKITSLPLNMALDEFQDLLLDAYVEGFAAAEYFLGGDAELKEKDYLGVLDKKYDGVSIMEKFSNYYETDAEEDLERLIDSEFHRAYNQGSYDNAIQSKGIKRWETMEDDKVRETHEYLQSVTAPIDGYFTTFDGDKARFPGDFSKAENNANCRCFLSYE